MRNKSKRDREAADFTKPSREPCHQRAAKLTPQKQVQGIQSSGTQGYGLGKSKYKRLG